MRPGEEPMTVSVVVPVYNAARTIDGCLAGLAAQSLRPDEVVLVDNGSTDGSRERLEAFASGACGLRVIVASAARRGAAAARNAGIARSSGRLVAFTDADCRPRPDWLERLVAGFDGEAVGAVAGAVVAAAASGVVEQGCGLFTLRSGRRPERHARLALGRGGFPGGFPTANLAVRRDLLVRTGAFDPSLATYGEDYDLCARLYAAGALLRVCPEAVVEHVHRDALGAFLRQAYGVGASHAWLLKRHARGTVLVDLPRVSVRREGSRLSAWIDLAGPDKVLAVIAALGVVHPAALALVPLQAVRLFAAVSRAAREEGRDYPAARRWAMAGLLLLRSAALTAGRIRGAVRERVLCV